MMYEQQKISCSSHAVTKNQWKNVFLSPFNNKNKDLENWNSNIWRVWCREQVIWTEILKNLSNFSINWWSKGTFWKLLTCNSSWPSKIIVLKWIFVIVGILFITWKSSTFEQSYGIIFVSIRRTNISIQSNSKKNMNYLCSLMSVRLWNFLLVGQN